MEIKVLIVNLKSNENADGPFLFLFLRGLLFTVLEHKPTLNFVEVLFLTFSKEMSWYIRIVCAKQIYTAASVELIPYRGLQTSTFLVTLLYRSRIQ